MNPLPGVTTSAPAKLKSVMLTVITSPADSAVVALKLTVNVAAVLAVRGEAEIVTSVTAVGGGVWQTDPVKPAVHEQMALVGPLVQVPPFWHGLEAQ